MRDRRRLIFDLNLRFAGLVALVLAALALRELGILLRRPPHPATVAELLLAAAGFLGASGGAMLATLGHHIFDQVVVSARWRRTRSVEPVFRAAPQRVETLASPAT